MLCSCGTIYADEPITEDNCPQHEILIGNKTGVVRWRSISSVLHGLFVYYYGTCFTCSTTYDNLYTIESQEQHQMYYVTGRHLTGELRHQVTYQCTICKYTVIENVYCPGPDAGGCLEFGNQILCIPPVDE